MWIFGASFLFTNVPSEVYLWEHCDFLWPFETPPLEVSFIYKSVQTEFKSFRSEAGEQNDGWFQSKTGRIDKMTKYTVYYFNVKGRGEIVRLMLTAAGVDFEDHRVQGEEWAKLKPSKFIYTIHGKVEQKQNKTGISVSFLDHEIAA